ncbi:MAG: hypothetical protein RLZZ373_602, partial [Pseudomonadota bacterium]
MSLIERLKKVPATLLLVAGLCIGASNVTYAQSEAAKPVTPAASTTEAPKPAPESAENPYGLKAIIE